jgi:hypothetical protein
VSEIAGVKLDREVNVVAMADGQVLPLPPGSGMVSPDGKVCVRWWWQSGCTFQTSNIYGGLGKPYNRDRITACKYVLRVMFAVEGFLVATTACVRSLSVLALSGVQASVTT